MKSVAIIVESKAGNWCSRRWR